MRGRERGSSVSDEGQGVAGGVRRTVLIDVVTW